MSDTEKPMSTEVLQVHLKYLREEQHSTRGDIQKVLAGMSEMATKSDLKELSAKFVTTDRFDALEKKVDAGTISSSFDRWVSVITKLFAAGTAFAAFVGVTYAFFHYFDKIQAIIK